MIAYGWLAWLALFLLYEVPAAIAEVIYDRRGKPRAITLSRNVWRWVGLSRGQEWRPYRRLRQASVFVFLQALAFHLPFGWPGGAVIAITAIPVGVVIAYAAFVEDRRERELRRTERFIVNAKVFDSDAFLRAAVSGPGIITPVAQRKERLASNERAGGSIPPGRSTITHADVEAVGRDFDSAFSSKGGQ